MRRGRPKKPTISVESVEATLKTLGHQGSEVAEAVALQHLALVDMYLENPARPPTEDLRGWALRSLLVEIITESLAEQRYFFDLSPTSSREKRKTALSRIQQDSQQNSSVLLGWCILFYRYVRSDLAITVQEMADYVNVHERTIRRERQNAILRLRDKLADAEWEARQVNQRRMLRSSIPEKRINLFERDSELNLVFDALESERTSHFFVTGVGGIGKSAFAATVAHHLVDTDSIDFVIWSHKPQQCVEVIQAVQDALLPYPNQAKISSLLLEYRTLVVIDDAESLIIDYEEWLELLRDLTHAIVIVCNREHVLLPHPLIHIPIGELSEFGIYELIGTYPVAKTIDAKLQKQIWEHVAGNPRAVDYALRQIANGNPIQFGEAALASLYDNVYNSLDDAHRILWVLLAAFPNGIKSKFLASILNADTYFFDYGLMETLDSDNEILRLISSARIFAESIAQSNSDLLSLVNEQIIELIGSQSSVSVAFLEILDCSWLKISVKTRQFVLSACDTRTLTVPQLRKWWHFTTLLEEATLELLLLKGIAARRLHYYEQSFSILQQVIQHTGQMGEFIQQAFARYELAVLYQSRAEFDNAICIYAELENYLSRKSSNDLLEQIKRQQVRIAIEKGNAETALQYLESYSHTIQDEILHSEALLIQADTEACRNHARDHLHKVKEEPILTSVLYTIIGRSYLEDGNTTEALDYFNAALALTERFSTDFDIARARCNLASIYLQSGEKQSLDYAEELLRQAIKKQERIQDAVGLLITERNLQYLHKLRLN